MLISFEASVEALAELRSQGKIRLIGLSNVTQEHIERARKIVPIVSVQNRYSFADQEWDYVVDYCERNGIVFIPWAPLGFAGVERFRREPDRQGASGHAKTDCHCMGLAALADHVADSGNFIARARGGKYRRRCACA